MSLIMLLGPPGSGKGEQCARLAKLGWETVSTGQLLRQAAASDNEVGRAVKALLNTGSLVPDEHVLQLLREHLAQTHHKKLILDGFPRTLSQVHSMSALGLMPNKLFVMVIPDDVILQRLCGRWVEPKSGRVYHDLYHPPRVPGLDDLTGDPLHRRDDDHPDIIRARLAIYHKTVEEMLGFYAHHQQRHELLITYLDATDSIDSVHTALCAML